MYASIKVMLFSFVCFSFYCSSIIHSHPTFFAYSIELIYGIRFFLYIVFKQNSNIQSIGKSRKHDINLIVSRLNLFINQKRKIKNNPKMTIKQNKIKSTNTNKVLKLIWNLFISYFLILNSVGFHFLSQEHADFCCPA